MRYYPVNLDILGRHCLVVGGGAVGLRKVTTLIDCGAAVTVVSPQVNAALLQLSHQHKITLHQRAYRTADLAGMFLVIGATNNEVLNRQIKNDADARGILCNIVDRPNACNFILPSIVNRGDLLIAISTCGKSPAFAKHLRKELEQQFGPEYARFLQLMGAIRTRLLSRDHATEAHKKFFEQLIENGLLDLVRNGDEKRIDALLLDVLGKGFEYKALVNLTT
jgi:precorrin-2 dehydrogenase/sirohydrochlorin ferrochelatase